MRGELRLKESAGVWSDRMLAKDDNGGNEAVPVLAFLRLELKTGE
jgi:hypothetical protein